MCFSHKRCKDACSPEKTSEARVPHGSARGELIPGSPSLVPKWPSSVFSISKSLCQRNKTRPTDCHKLTQDIRILRHFNSFFCLSKHPPCFHVRAATCCLVSTISPVRLGVFPSPPTVIIIPLMISVATCIEKCSSIVQPPSPPHQHTLYMPIPQLGFQAHQSVAGARFIGSASSLDKPCYNHMHRTPWTPDSDT